MSQVMRLNSHFPRSDRNAMSKRINRRVDALQKDESDKADKRSVWSVLLHQEHCHHFHLNFSLCEGIAWSARWRAINTQFSNSTAKYGNLWLKLMDAAFSKSEMLALFVVHNSEITSAFLLPFHHWSEAADFFRQLCFRFKPKANEAKSVSRKEKHVRFATWKKNQGCGHSNMAAASNWHQLHKNALTPASHWKQNDSRLKIHRPRTRGS